MSTIGEAVVERMLSDVALIYLIDERLYPNVIPQDIGMPAIAYQLVDAQHVASRDGGSHLARSLFQFTCEADTYSGAKSLAEAVRECWEAYAGVILDLEIYGALITNELDEFSEQHMTHVVRLDVAIWHTEGVTITQEATT